MIFNNNKQQNYLSEIDNNKKFDVAITKLTQKFRCEIYKISLKLFAIFINCKIRQSLTKFKRFDRKCWKKTTACFKQFEFYEMKIIKFNNKSINN